MQLPAEYEAPEHLMEHCFVRETAKAKLQELRQINADLAAAMTPISNTKKQQKTDVKLQNNKQSRPVSYKPLQKLHLNIELKILAQI